MNDDRITLGDITFTSAEVTRTYLTFIIQSPFAIILYDNNGLHYVNPTGLRLFGVPDLADLRRHSLMDFIAEDKREALATLLATSSHQTGSPLETKFHNTLAQEFDVEITTASMVVGGQEIVQVTIRDVSSRNLIEEIHRRHHEWKIIRNFIRHLADKTLNPLTTIEGFLTLIKEGADDVNIDMLLNEAKSIQKIWIQAIQIAQKTDTISMGNQDLWAHVDVEHEF